MEPATPPSTRWGAGRDQGTVGRKGAAAPASREGAVMARSGWQLTLNTRKSLALKSHQPARAGLLPPRQLSVKRSMTAVNLCVTRQSRVCQPGPCISSVCARTPHTHNHTTQDTQYKHTTRAYMQHTHSITNSSHDTTQAHNTHLPTTYNTHTQHGTRNTMHTYIQHTCNTTCTYVDNTQPNTYT